MPLGNIKEKLCALFSDALLETVHYLQKDAARGKMQWVASQQQKAEKNGDTIMAGVWRNKLRLYQDTMNIHHTLK